MGLARASFADTFRVAATVLAPTLAQGVIMRRRRLVTVAQWLRADDRAVRLLQRLRDRHQTGVVVLRLPVRRPVAFVLTSNAVRRILKGTPDPFTTATVEKTAALSHFQPDGVLISRGPLRESRRRVHETVLDTDLPAHHLAPVITRKVRDEFSPLLAGAPTRLGWNAFNTAFWRCVRRIVLGDGARDDDELIDLLAALRRDANWAYLRPVRTALGERFHRRLASHLDRAEPGSLAELLAQTAVSPEIDAYGQVPHWLFAFDAAGATAFRTLALLSTHAHERERVLAELRTSIPGTDLPMMRACVLDTVRLWPTTLAILRESTADTRWGGQFLPPRTTFVIYTPYFHRDDQNLPYADYFEPQIWLDGRAATEWSLVPFSAGPAACPGRNLVLLVTSAILATMLEHHELRLLSHTPLSPARPLPRTLNHANLRFKIVER